MFIFLCEVADAIPVFPGAEGFGTDTIAGRGGKVIKVTNLNASGAGSFKEAVETDGARIVVFEVSGTIKIDGKITPQEENLIFHYGFKLGFNESLVREMIIVIKEHMGKKLPPESLISKVKKYLN